MHQGFLVVTLHCKYPFDWTCLETVALSTCTYCKCLNGTLLSGCYFQVGDTIA